MNNQMILEKKYIVKEIGKMIDVPERTINDTINRIFPGKAKNGIKTYLNEIEVSEISKELKKAHNSNLAVTGELRYTVREISEMIDVPIKTIQNAIGRIYPNKMFKGKITSFINAKGMEFITKLIGNKI